MKVSDLFIFLGIFLIPACTFTTSPASDVVQPVTTPSPSNQMATGYPPEGNTIVVISAVDRGPGSLRQALREVKAYDTITFDPAVFPPNAPVAIRVSSELPHINVGNLTIDASNAGVILDGNNISGDWTAGLQIVSSDANTVMGLQIVGFSGPGIAISGDAKHNMIGGDHSLGAGPYGQGNHLIQNAVGISLSTKDTMFNTITGNLIGTVIGGVDGLGNHQRGVSISEGANNNIIGPNNIIAYNEGPGVSVHHIETQRNTITQNSIYENSGRDIDLMGGGNILLAAPIIFEYDLLAGAATGITCPNCTVEIFSDISDGGATYEGWTTANDKGEFTIIQGAAFAGPNLTATSTDGEGNTSQFSRPTSDTAGVLFIQRDNDHLQTQFMPKQSGKLNENHIGAQFDSFGYPEFYDLEIYSRGVTRARVAIAGLEPELVDWDKPEFSIDPTHDEVFTRMADRGITITYVLTFWDKETYPDGDGAPCARFKTEGEIERYLAFVRFIVGHFKDRVQYYEIWNEPDIRGYCPKWIEVGDYISLVKRTVPVIREVYPDAKIVVGGVSNTKFPEAYDYLFALLESEIMPLVDVISWHPMYGTSPAYDDYRDYYYGYPAMVQKIKDTAAAHGFVGEYQADEIGWATPETAVPDQPWVYSPAVAPKYWGRGIVMHRGMDVGVGGGEEINIIRNLCTVMDGAEPVNLPIEIQSTAENIVSYTFAYPNGDYLIAMWTDGIAFEYDPGIESSLIVSGFSAAEVIGIDVLYGFEQQLITRTENGNILIENLMVKDYPILIRFSESTSPQ